MHSEDIRDTLRALIVALTLCFTVFTVGQCSTEQMEVGKECKPIPAVWKRP